MSNKIPILDLKMQYARIKNEIALPHEEPDNKHTYHLYVIRIKERDKLKEFLEEKGIQTCSALPNSFTPSGSL